MVSKVSNAFDLPWKFQKQAFQPGSAVWQKLWSDYPAFLISLEMEEIMEQPTHGRDYLHYFKKKEREHASELHL